MAKPIDLLLIPLGDPEAFTDALVADPDRSLGALLAEVPAYAVNTPLDENLLARRVSELRLRQGRLQAPNGASIDLARPAAPPPADPQTATQAAADRTPPGQAPTPPAPVEPAPTAHPASLSEQQAVAIAYQAEVSKLASFLRSRLSLLVSCEKLVTPYLWPLILQQTWLPAADGSAREQRLQPVLLELPEGDDANPLGGGNRLGRLRQIIKELKSDQLLVVPNLDLLGGGGEKGLNRESRELTELIYGALDRLVLAFVDPSLPVPEVIAARFPVRVAVEGLRREVTAAGQDTAPVPIGAALVTAAEAACFEGFDPLELYKNVAGLNPLRLREALAYAVQVARDQDHGPERPADRKLLYRELRAFKAQGAEQFAIPDIGFGAIGGYKEVKQTLTQAIALISGAGQLPDEALRHELTPRGFLFHGPPGTGKTLFAKAIANSLNATIRIVSGPEVTDMYVGESERKLRALFAEARRSAPAVIVFDEFDAIAARRTGRDDGGSRAGNALVAQILTEMDGFRPEVPLLVIGTTNRLGLIDEALLRPSRFQPVAIGLPDRAARRQIARIHADHFHIPLDAELLEILAHATQGLNGDDIRSIFRDLCVRHYYAREPQPITPWDLGFQVGRVRTRLDQQRPGGEARPPPRPGERPRPMPGRVSLTGGPRPTSSATDTLTTQRR